MSAPILLKELRPSEIVEMSWRESLDIPENAEVLEPVYFESEE